MSSLRKEKPGGNANDKHGKTPAVVIVALFIVILFITFREMTTFME
jgi:hypothetical protein